MAENGYEVIPTQRLMALLYRAHAGEDPDLLYAEQYANASHEAVENPDV